MVSNASAPRSPTRALGVWGLLAAGTLAAFWPLFSFDPQAGVVRAVDGLEGVLFDPSGEDPRLIGALALWMLITRRGRVAAAWRRGAGRPAIAAALFAAALAVQAWAAHVGAPDLQIHALQLFLLGGAALLGGRDAMRAVLLPVLFLLLAMPIPAAMLNAWLLPLQLATVQVCTEALRLVGLEALGFGDQILMRRGIFHVIETCSGVRLVQTLVMAAVVYGELFGRPPSRTLALVVSAPIIGIAVNLARILSIVFNPWASITSVHTTQGVAMVVIGVLALAGLDRLLSRWWPPPARERGPSEPLVEHPLDGRLAIIGTLLVALIATWVWTPRWSDDAVRAAIGELPRQIQGRRANGLSPDLVFLGSVHFSDRIFRSYAPRGPAPAGGVPEILLFFGTDDHSNRRGSMLSGKTAYPGRAWERLAVTGGTLDGETPVEIALFAHPESERRLVVHWREGFESPLVESLRGWLGLDRSALGRSERAYVWRLEATVADASELEAIQEELLVFARNARNAWQAAEANALSRP